MLKLYSDSEKGENSGENPRMFLACSKCGTRLKMGEIFDIPSCSCGGDTQIVIRNDLAQLSMEEILEQALGCSFDSLVRRIFDRKEFVQELLKKSCWTFEEISALAVLLVIIPSLNEERHLDAYNFGLVLGLVKVIEEQACVSEQPQFHKP